MMVLVKMMMLVTMMVMKMMMLVTMMVVKMMMLVTMMAMVQKKLPLIGTCHLLSKHQQ